MGQLQLSEALGTALGAGLGGTLLTLGGQLGLGARAAHGAIFVLTVAVALLGMALSGRALAPRPGLPVADPPPIPVTEPG